MRIVVHSWKEEGRLTRVEEPTRLGLSIAVAHVLGELPNVLFVQRSMRLWGLFSSRACVRSSVS